MLTYAIIAAVIAIICYALARNNIGLPFTNIGAMIAGGLALLFFVVWLFFFLTRGGPIEVDDVDAMRAFLP
jgi:hypothetical protein